MSNTENPTPETEEVQQPTMMFTVECVDVDEEPSEWGGRYKRPGQQPRPRSRDRALNKGEFGKAEDLQAVFDSRAAYFQENPKPETMGEVREDSRDLGHVLPDFPGVHDFVFEMETARMKAVDRGEIIDQARQQLETLSRQLEAGEVGRDEILKQLQQTASALRRTEEDNEILREVWDAEAPRDAVGEERLTLREIEALIPLTRSTLSEHIENLRREDAGKPEKERRIKTAKGKRITRREFNALKVYLDTIPPRPGRRKKRL